MNISKLFVAVGLVFIGLMSRFIPHLPDFTALSAIALCSACYLSSRTICLSTVFLTLLISDLLLGFHTTILFVYAGMGCITLLALRLKSYISLMRMPLFSLGASVILYLISDFGVWLTSGMYEKSFNGLILCYTAALPYLRNLILGDLFYSGALYLIGAFLIAKATCLSDANEAINDFSPSL
ncbi:MAG: hypothetical protein Q8K60_08150 [Parachlamydiaceae bacterium]|nr:hypothetical protein [Parachlamydiaceae bacterium]